MSLVPKRTDTNVEQAREMVAVKVLWEALVWGIKERSGSWASLDSTGPMPAWE